MIKALSLAAALALLPLSASVAQEARGPSEAAIEAAAEAFEARMEAFGERAEAISEDKSLSEEQRELHIAALWTEYQPDVNAFTATVTRHASALAAEALAEVDIEAVVAEALEGVDIGALTANALGSLDPAVLSGAMTGAQGALVNGAWASNDPEHMETYGLVADYLIGEAFDAVPVDRAAATEAAVAPEPGSDEG